MQQERERERKRERLARVEALESLIHPLVSHPVETVLPETPCIGWQRERASEGVFVLLPGSPALVGNVLRILEIVCHPSCYAPPPLTPSEQHHHKEHTCTFHTYKSEYSFVQLRKALSSIARFACIVYKCVSGVTDDSTPPTPSRPRRQIFALFRYHPSSLTRADRKNSQLL